MFSASDHHHFILSMPRVTLSVFLQTDPAISRLVQGEVEISPDHETVFVANSPRFFMCSSFNPEEV